MRTASKYKAVIVVGSLIFLFIVLNSAGVFFEHWSDIDLEYVAAQEYLQSPVCKDEAIKARVGEYAEGCKRAKAFTNVYPVWRALFRTITEWYVCSGPSCTVMMRAILDSAWNVIIIVLIAAVALLYITGHRGSSTILSHGTLPMTYAPRRGYYLEHSRENFEDIE